MWNKCENSRQAEIQLWATQVPAAVIEAAIATVFVIVSCRCDYSCSGSCNHICHYSCECCCHINFNCSCHVSCQWFLQFSHRRALDCWWQYFTNSLFICLCLEILACDWSGYCGFYANFGIFLMQVQLQLYSMEEAISLTPSTTDP